MDCSIMVKNISKITESRCISSHMLDLSEEPLKENIEICKKYLERMSKMGMTLEIELGVTGGEEDGMDNTGLDNSLLYTQPEDVAYAYEELNEDISEFHHRRLVWKCSWCLQAGKCETHT